MAYRQHLHPVLVGDKSVQGHVPGASAGNHQFANRAPKRATDHGMAPKHAGRLDDRLRRLLGDNGIVLREKIENAVEVGERSVCERDPRHRAYRARRARARGLGRAAFLPAARALM